MDNVGAFLDFLSRIVALALAILALGGFILRKWISAWIDDRFKRRIETELVKIKHEYSLEVEQKKAELTKEVEKYRREVDDQIRRSSRIYDKKVEAYEIFDSEYGRVIAEIYALHSMNADSQISPEISNVYRLRAFGVLTAAKERLRPYSLYFSRDLMMKESTLFRDLNVLLSEGVKNKDRVDQLALAFGMTVAQMKQELFDKS